MESIPVWPPRPGYYSTSLVRNGPQVAVRIWFGNAIIDGEEQDRGEDWRCEIDGRTDYVEKDEKHPEYQCRIPLHIDRVWPFCAKRPLSEGEYNYMKDHGYWAKHHAKHMPDANPRKAIDRRGPSVF